MTLADYRLKNYVQFKIYNLKLTIEKMTIVGLKSNHLIMESLNLSIFLIYNQVMKEGKTGI